MGSLLTVFLPLSLAVIMFSLGLGLTLDDFRRVATRPLAFGVGALNQIVLLPIFAFIIASLSGLPPELSLGLMILAFCPGGVTSNILTKFAKGDVAMSVSLTAITSLLAVLTVPPLAAMAANHFMGINAPPINVTSLAISMALITALPVALGIALRHFAPAIAARIEPVMSMIATILFVIIVVAALAQNWDVFTANLPVLGPSLVALNVILLLVGYGSARMLNLPRPTASAIAIETGTQNATLGIAIGSIIAASSAALPAFSLPSGVYGITMYLVVLPFVLWRRSAAQN
jgi:BASS family bile acid:Na+ symporter